MPCPFGLTLTIIGALSLSTLFKQITILLSALLFGESESIIMAGLSKRCGILHICSSVKPCQCALFGDFSCRASFKCLCVYNIGSRSQPISTRICGVSQTFRFEYFGNTPFKTSFICSANVFSLLTTPEESVILLVELLGTAGRSWFSAKPIILDGSIFLSCWVTSAEIVSAELSWTSTAWTFCFECSITALSRYIWTSCGSICPSTAWWNI